jgi:MFS family permease
MFREPVALIVHQYADLRAAYPPEQIGRALSLFTMAMFGGIATMQWLTGVVATVATSHSGDRPAAAMFVIAGLLAAGVVAYWLLPWPREMLKPAIEHRAA